MLDFVEGQGGNPVAVIEVGASPEFAPVVVNPVYMFVYAEFEGDFGPVYFADVLGSECFGPVYTAGFEPSGPDLHYCLLAPVDCLVAAELGGLHFR